jgi:acid stress-induced BolA-like protein IbaG/YrbA
MTPEMIKNFIVAGLDCTHIEVEGDGRHFYAVIVSPLFEKKTSLARHQLVYKVLGDKMQEDIHALSMKTFTPEEYTYG